MCNCIQLPKCTKVSEIYHYNRILVSDHYKISTSTVTHWSHDHVVLQVFYRYCWSLTGILPLHCQCNIISHSCSGEVDMLEHVQKFLPSSTVVHLLTDILMSLNCTTMFRYVIYVSFIEVLIHLNRQICYSVLLWQAKWTMCDRPCLKKYRL